MVDHDARLPRLVGRVLCGEHDVIRLAARRAAGDVVIHRRRSLCARVRQRVRRLFHRLLVAAAGLALFGPVVDDNHSAVGAIGDSNGVVRCVSAEPCLYLREPRLHRAEPRRAVQCVLGGGEGGDVMVHEAHAEAGDENQGVGGQVLHHRG